MAILKPNMVPTITPFDSLTKAEMATIINRQTTELRNAIHDKGAIMSVLCAIVQHPDAFSVNEAGHAQIEVEAIEELKENTQFHTKRVGDDLELTVTVSTYLLRADPMRIGTSFADIH